MALGKHKRQNRQFNTRSLAVKPFTTAMPNRSVRQAEPCLVKQAISGSTSSRPDWLNWIWDEQAQP